MTIRTENDPRYSRRFLLMGIAAIGFALWSLYDGAIKYPAVQERALKFQEYLSKDRSAWDAYATERGWPLSDPGEPKSDEEHKGDVVMQYAMAVIAGTIGLLLLSIPLRARGRWIESSESGLTSSWGQSLNFDDVIALDKRQWRSKGIARITYVDGGRKRRFVLDNYKFDRRTTDAILYELEQKIDPANITGGPPEPPPEEQYVQDASAIDSKETGSLEPDKTR